MVSEKSKLLHNETEELPPNPAALVGGQQRQDDNLAGRSFAEAIARDGSLIRTHIAR